MSVAISKTHSRPQEHVSGYGSYIISKTKAPLPIHE